MVFSNLTLHTKDATADDQALEQLLNEAKKRVDGNLQSTDNRDKTQIEIERVPDDERHEDVHKPPPL